MSRFRSPNHDPIEAKTANGTLTGSLVFVVAGYLCVYVFHLDASKTAIITGAAPVLLGFVASYSTHHTPRLHEIVNTVTDELAHMGYLPEYEEPAQPVSAAYTQQSWLEEPGGTLTASPTIISAADLGREQEDPYSAEHLADDQP